MKILNSLQEPTLCVHILLVCDVLNSGNHMPGTPLPCPAPAWTIDGYKWDTRLCVARLLGNSQRVNSTPFSLPHENVRKCKRVSVMRI